MNMFYALVHFPAITTNNINQLRKEYDPLVNWIDPHITVVFPIKGVLDDEQRLIDHIETVLRAWKPFSIHLQGLEHSFDNYLYLTLQEGNTDVIKLHDEMYTAMLRRYRRDDILFIPHVTLGVFHQDAHKYTQALEQAKKFNLSYHCVLDRLHLLKFLSYDSPISLSKELLL
ncbi:MAG: 2'-5' RNA ligase family protein [Stigonema ocellatum SAG 48.90 = DSM 106950]|nr:2'-5' RNA ligase family protein [Stigonema ocellatum SAG 48.90 = DSM 106950]